MVICIKIKMISGKPAIPLAADTATKGDAVFIQMNRVLDSSGKDRNIQPGNTIQLKARKQRGLLYLPLLKFAKVFGIEKGDFIYYTVVNILPIGYNDN